MDKIIVVIAFIVLAALLVSALGDVPDKPEPDATPIPQSAELVLAQAVSEIAVESSAADRNTAHPSPTPVPPSETVRIVRAAALPLFGSVACLCGVFCVGILALVWHNVQVRRDKLVVAQELRAGIETVQADLEKLRTGIESQ